MSQLQNNQFEFIGGVMDEVGLKYHLAHLNIKKEDLVVSLLNVQNYVGLRPNLWYSIINDSAIDEAWALEAIQELRF